MLRDLADAIDEAPRLPITALLFDAFLEGRLLSDEIIERFGPANVRILSPNLDPDVVAGLRRLKEAQPTAMIIGGLGCYHAFVDHWESLIAVTGGIQVLMADCHRSFCFGAGPLIRLLGDRRLYFAPTASGSVASRRSRMVLVTSLLYDRIHHPDGQEGAIRSIKKQLLCMSSDAASPYAYTIQNEFDYNTMMVTTGLIGEKTRSEPASVDEFLVRTTLEQIMTDEERCAMNQRSRIDVNMLLS